MPEVVLAHQVDFATWRKASSHFVRAGVLPESIFWQVAQAGQEAAWSAEPAQNPPDPPQGINLSRRFVGVLAQALQAHDPERFTILYRIVYRLAYAGLALTDTTDPDLLWLRQPWRLSGQIRCIFVKFFPRLPRRERVTYCIARQSIIFWKPTPITAWSGM